MGTTPTNSHSLHLKKSRSTSIQIENPSISFSESVTDVGLPQELITEILLCLPVKSLLKFKCVSKSWMSSISSSQFIRHHFSKSSREDEDFNHQLLFTTGGGRMKQCSLYSALHEAEPSPHVSDIAFFPEYPPRIVGIINGLVCLATEVTGLFLWNPVLRKSKHLPSWNDNQEAPFISVNYGFGYDESNDDYKVVCLLPVFGINVSFEAEVRVYSLRADSWRRIEDLKGFFPIYETGIYANGKMYWSALVRGDSGYSTWNKKIFRLDMVSDKYGEVQQPDYEAVYNDLKLGVLGGRLIVLYDYYRTKGDLWVMDKYGADEENWRKVVSIPYDDVDPPTPYSRQQVLCILLNCEIVLADEFDFLVYNSKHKESRKIELEVGTSSYFKVAAYVESLVWPYE